MSKCDLASMKALRNKRGWLVAAVMLMISSASAMAEPDVILGRLFDTQWLASQGGTTAIEAGTISCNTGNETLQWYPLPRAKHPVIALNLYRLFNGRMEQLGQSWVKHAFGVASGDECRLGCKASQDPNGPSLGRGCSDPYGSGLNSQTERLHPRFQINPTTGVYDGNAINAPRPPANGPLERRLQVPDADLAVAGARYFIEGHYVHPDDAAAGNGNNNVSYREVAMSRAAGGAIAMSHPTETVQRRPALKAWEGAEFVNVDAPEATVGNRSLASRVIVGFRVTQVAAYKHRYEYAVYNMNSERAVRSFSIPIGAMPADRITGIGFKAVLSHTIPHSNAPWTNRIEAGRITWSTETFAANKEANAIRWGTMYNFWFEAMAAPTEGGAELGRFKPGTGPETMTATMAVPGGSPAP